MTSGTDVTLESIISPESGGTVPDRPILLEPPRPADFGPDTRLENRTFARFRPLLKPCGYFVMSRLAVLFSALGANWLAPKLHPLRTLATGWDGSWYLRIAQHGYPHGLFDEGVGNRWAFFPAYPSAVRGLVAATGLSYPNAALVLSFIFGMASAAAIWLALREVFGPVIADRSVLLYVFFPASYVLSMAYTEGLFLMAAGLCLYALSRRYWITAGCMAALGSLTRNFGLILIACVVVAALPVVVRERKVRPLVAMGVAVIPFLGWLAYSWSMTGTPLAFLKAQQFWPHHAHFIWFLSPFASLLHLLSSVHGFTDGQAVLATGALLFVYIGLALLNRARQEGFSIPLFWWVFTIGSVLTVMSPYSPTSVLRYSMAVFPLFAAFAWKIRASWEGTLVGMLAMSQGALAVIVLVGTLHTNTSIIWP